jgi:hypothetical protein
MGRSPVLAGEWQGNHASGSETIMPVFEYRCQACQRKFSALIGMTAEPDEVKCPACGSQEAQKLVSRFARYRNEDDRIDELADKFENMADVNDHAAMRGMVRDLGKAMDEDVADEMEELFEADLAGDIPDDE